MLSAIANFFGIGSSNDDDSQAQQQEPSAADGAVPIGNNDGDEESLRPPVQTRAEEMRDARKKLSDLHDELEHVKSSITSARTLVDKATFQEEEMQVMLHCLNLESHDTFLHPELRGDKQDADSRRLQAKIASAIHALETTYLPNLRLQRDNLDLGAFRLNLRFTKLVREEQATSIRLRDLQAEVNETRTRYMARSADADGNRPLPDGDDEGDVVPPPPAPYSIVSKK